MPDSAAALAEAASSSLTVWRDTVTMMREKLTVNTENSKMNTTTVMIDT
jgi:hypothetical protein